MAGQADQGGIVARRAALRLLNGVTGEGQLLPELLGAGVLDALGPEDRARAQRLTLQVLRGLPTADRILKPYLQKSPPLAVRNALRLGVVEMAQGAAAHGVVNAMVTIVGQGKRTASFRGLMNAVLRKAGEDAAGAWATAPVPKLPTWLRGPLVDAWGRDIVARIETVQATLPPLDLTVKADASGWATRLAGTLLPTGSVRLAQAGQISTLEGFATGDWWVQDAAAALPVGMLGDVAGRRVLDLCAAPGGKTMQLAARGAQVTAVDDNPARMARVAENLARTGLGAEMVVADALTLTGTWDAVLLDAPCSATGTIRRHPDLPQAKDGSAFAALIAQQAAMLDHALTLLAPGGRLVFCTCSLLPDEGEVQLAEALDRHPGLAVVDVLPEGADPAWRAEGGGLRLRPDLWADRGGMDGFFMAAVCRA